MRVFVLLKAVYKLMSEEKSFFVSLENTFSSHREVNLFFNFFCLYRGLNLRPHMQQVNNLPLSQSSDPNNSTCNFKPQFNVLKRKQKEVEIVKSFY